MIDGGTAQRPDDAITMSIVVVTHDEGRLLENALVALSLQECVVPLQVVVVDNGSRRPVGDPALPTGLAPITSIVRRARSPKPFSPGSARNEGVAAATGDIVLFLDGDCCPAPHWAAAHLSALRRSDAVVSLGHRVFVDAACLTPGQVEELRGDLSSLPRVASSSNYDLVGDRRLPELVALESHPAPYNCCHGCNFGVHRERFLAAGGFDAVFDGSWGYEDIELGHRLWQRGAEFRYVPEGLVFHQEGVVDIEQRRTDRRRNYRIACETIPGFEDFRLRQQRPYYALVNDDG